MWEALLKFCLDSASLPDKQRHDLIHGVPILFTANVQKELERAASNLPPESAAKVKPVLQELSDLRTRYEEQKEEYPIGLGPIEKIFRQVRDGEISEQEGEHQAVEPRVVLSLGPLYVQALSAFNLTTAREGQWRDAALMQKLLVLALKTFERTGSMGDALPNAVLNWIEIVHVYVYQLPDPRLFRNAIEEGEALIAAQKDGNDALVGEVSHRLGTLHLDPYAARNSLHYESQMSQWRQRFYDSMGPAIAQLAPADRDMPEPLAALSKAEEYLSRAAKLRTGTRRGQSLKALAQAIQWQVILGKEDRKEDFVRACTEAMQALAPQESPQEWVSVLNMRGAGASPEERETLDRILSTSWDSHVAKIGMRYTLDLISQSAQFFYNNDAPERCLRLLVETRPLFETEGDERKLIDRWILLLSCLSKIAKLPPAAREGPAATCREHLVAIAGKENWGPGRMAAGLLWLANLSERTNEEASGLEFLAEASRLAPLLTADLKDMIDYQHVLLWMGRGVNGVNAQQWGQAVHDYAASLSLALQFKSNDIRTDLLARIDDVAGKGPDTALPVAAGLIPKSLKIERLMGEPGGRWLRQLTKHTLAGIDKSTDPEVLSLLCQLGKGSRFAASLAAGACYQWKDDSEAERLLGLIAATEADLKSRQIAAPDDSDPDLDDSVVLCAYGEVVNPDAEDSPWQRLYNLQRSFDSHVINQLLSYAGDETGWYLHLPDIQASLDSRTVLLNFYLGATARKTVAVSAVAITRDEVRAGVVSHELPDGLVNMKGSKISVSVHPLARAVVNVRTEIAYSPGPGRGITPEGEQALTSDVRGFFGYLLEYLQEARSKGKDHLCIVPHGPLHFYPFHLLQDAGKPLAENMIVTYLPNLALLLAPRGQPSVFRYRARPLSALGLTFQEVHAFGLDELPQSAQESASIADLFQTKPVLEQAATEEAMRDALLNSRYVHLSTHGAHNISAPAFQCLFLAPAGENDGRLCAHEVLKLDLRGLEMLTLSACETALGRFDEADNLRGLPSAFLQAGVATILGTLWPVAAEPAEHFFTQLYANVQHGMDRRDAFYQAQQETRKTFPVYRDWGAFYYIGTWR